MFNSTVKLHCSSLLYTQAFRQVEENLAKLTTHMYTHIHTERDRVLGPHGRSVGFRRPVIHPCQMGTINELALVYKVDTRNHVQRTSEPRLRSVRLPGRHLLGDGGARFGLRTVGIVAAVDLRNAEAVERHTHCQEGSQEYEDKSHGTHGLRAGRKTADAQCASC